MSHNIVEQLNTTARRVQHYLTQAGLNAVIDPTQSTFEGAVIEIDTGADECSGVYVQWRPNPALNSAASAALRSGDLNDSNLYLASSFRDIMKNAIEEILTASGFTVEPEVDDMRPASVRVTERPEA